MYKQQHNAKKYPNKRDARQHLYNSTLSRQAPSHKHLHINPNEKKTGKESRLPCSALTTARLPRASRSSRASQARASRATCASQHVFPAPSLDSTHTTLSHHSVLFDTSAHSTLSLHSPPKSYYCPPTCFPTHAGFPSSLSTHVRTALCPALFWRVASALRQSGEDTLPLPSAFPRFGNRQMRMMRLSLPFETGR